MTQEEIAKLFESAPEGATHYSKENGYFYRMNSLTLELYIGQAWRRSELFKSSRAALVARPAPQWNGEGLPPVGAAIDCKCTAKTKARDWFPAEVRYISPYTVVLVDYSTAELDGEFVAHPATLIFQPRRTPEQIAAEKREAAIDEMCGLVSMRGRDGSRMVMGELYDAGYRKTEGGAK